MDATLRCCALLLLVVYATVHTNGSMQEPLFTEYDSDHGHYSEGLLAAETSILQARTEILTLETNFTVKYNAKDILDLFTAMMTPAEDVAALQLEMQKRGRAINDAAKRVVDQSQSLIDVSNYINSHFENYTVSQLQFSKAGLKSEKDMLDSVVALCRENVLLSLLVVKGKIDLLVGTQTGPEVDEIHSIVNTTEFLMLAEQDKINAQKILVDAAYVQADAVLLTLISVAPPLYFEENKYY